MQFNRIQWEYNSNHMIYDQPLFWVNVNDLTATSLESWLVLEIMPKWPEFRLVKYYNLPRSMTNHYWKWAAYPSSMKCSNWKSPILRLLLRDCPAILDCRRVLMGNVLPTMEVIMIKCPLINNGCVKLQLHVYVYIYIYIVYIYIPVWWEIFIQSYCSH